MSRSKKGSKSTKTTVSKTRNKGLPLDAYEEWLKKQAIKPVLSKPEVQIPSDAYEEWIRKQIKKRQEN